MNDWNPTVHNPLSTGRQLAFKKLLSKSPVTCGVCSNTLPVRFLSH